MACDLDHISAGRRAWSPMQRPDVRFVR